jgi:hypothetical protein
MCRSRPVHANVRSAAPLPGNTWKPRGAQSAGTEQPGCGAALRRQGDRAGRPRGHGPCAGCLAYPPARTACSPRSSCPVMAAWLTRLGGANGLAVDDSRCWLGRTPKGDPLALAKGSVDFLLGANPPPLRVLPVHRRAGRELMRDRPATGSQCAGGRTPPPRHAAGRASVGGPPAGLG